MHSRQSFQRPSDLVVAEETEIPVWKAALMQAALFALLIGALIGVAFAVPVLQRTRVTTCIGADCYTWSGDGQ